MIPVAQLETFRNNCLPSQQVLAYRIISRARYQGLGGQVTNMEALALTGVAYMGKELGDVSKALLALPWMTEAFSAVVEADVQMAEGPGAPYMMLVVDRRFVAWEGQTKFIDTDTGQEVEELPRRPLRSVSLDLAMIYHYELGRRTDAPRPQGGQAQGESVEPLGRSR